MKTNFVTLLAILGAVVLLSACSEIQFVVHTAKRINNHFETPQETVEPSEIAASSQDNILALPQDEVSMSLQNVMELQTLLTVRGFDTEGIDGIVGPRTRKAVLNYQVATDIPPDGTPSVELLIELRQNSGI